MPGQNTKVNRPLTKSASFCCAEVRQFQKCQPLKSTKAFASISICAKNARRTNRKNKDVAQRFVTGVCRTLTYCGTEYSIKAPNANRRELSGEGRDAASN